MQSRHHETQGIRQVLHSHHSNSNTINCNNCCCFAASTTTTTTTAAATATTATTPTTTTTTSILLSTAATTIDSVPSFCVFLFCLALQLMMQPACPFCESQSQALVFRPRLVLTNASDEGLDTFSGPGVELDLQSVEPFPVHPKACRVAADFWQRSVHGA